MPAYESVDGSSREEYEQYSKVAEGALEAHATLESSTSVCPGYGGYSDGMEETAADPEEDE